LSGVQAGPGLLTHCWHGEIPRRRGDERICVRVLGNYSYR